MKCSLKSSNNFEYTNIFLANETSLISRHNDVNTRASRESMPRIHEPRNHEMLAIKCEMNKLRLQSRDSSRCRCNSNEEVYCLKVQPSGTTFRNPFCAVLGPKLCRNCSVHRNREQTMNDTEQILQEVRKRENIRDTKEEALLTRIRNSLEEGKLHENDIPVKMSSHLVRGAIARHNTPDIRYVNCRYGHHGNFAENEDDFCVSSLKSTLQRLSLTIEGNNKYDKNEMGRLDFPDSVDTPRRTYSGRHSSQGLDRSSGTRSYCCVTDIEGKLDGEALTQKLSNVFEQRYLPPVNNRSCSASSIVSLVEHTTGKKQSKVEHTTEKKKDLVEHTTGKKESKVEHTTGKKESKSAKRVNKGNVRKREEGKEKENVLYCSIVPPLMKVNAQLARQQMFLRDTAVTACITK